MPGWTEKREKSVCVCPGGVQGSSWRGALLSRLLSPHPISNKTTQVLTPRRTSLRIRKKHDPGTTILEELPEGDVLPVVSLDGAPEGGEVGDCGGGGC